MAPAAGQQQQQPCTSDDVVFVDPAAGSSPQQHSSKLSQGTPSGSRAGLLAQLKAEASQLHAVVRNMQPVFETGDYRWVAAPTKAQVMHCGAGMTC